MTSRKTATASGGSFAADSVINSTVIIQAAES